MRDALLPMYDLQGLLLWLEQRLGITNLLDYEDCMVLNHIEVLLEAQSGAPIIGVISAEDLGCLIMPFFGFRLITSLN